MKLEGKKEKSAAFQHASPEYGMHQLQKTVELEMKLKSNIGPCHLVQNSSVIQQWIIISLELLLYLSVMEVSR